MTRNGFEFHEAAAAMRPGTRRLIGMTPDNSGQYRKVLPGSRLSERCISRPVLQHSYARYHIINFTEDASDEVA